jgi:uncharacterized protein YbjT (DUF2867 family)
MNKALIFGGNGFLGSFVVKELCKHNFEVLVIGRSKKNFEDLKVFGFPGQVAFKHFDVSKLIELNKIKFNSFNLVINLIGIGCEKGANSYHIIHNDFASRVASLTYKSNIDFIHISAFTGDEASTSKYINSKRDGEKAVRKNNPNAVILRPSLIIGQNSSLISMFESLIQHAPFVPLPNIGKTKIQPIFAGDLAKVIVKCYQNSEVRGKAFDLAGTETILFKSFVEKICGFMNKKRMFITVPFFFVLNLLKIKRYLPSFIFRTSLTADIFALSKEEILIKENHIKLFIEKPVKVDEVLKLSLEKYRLYD